MLITFVAMNIYYLNVLIASIRLEEYLIVKKANFYKYDEFKINPLDIKKIELKDGNAHFLTLIMQNGDTFKLETVGLTDFYGSWEEPVFSDYMPLNPISRNAYKIAYNFQKKYNIEFASFFIK